VKHTTILSALILGCLLSVTPAAAQFSVEAEVGTMVDDNVNNNSLRLSDRIVSAGLQAGYDWIADRTNTTLQYTGGYNYFTVNPGRTNQMHGGAITFAQLFGDNEETLWNSAVNYGVRTDREEFAYYDNTALALSSALKHQFSDMFVGRFGYTLRLMRFAHLSSFDHAEHQVFVQSSVFLPSQTTIIGQVDLGMKLYSTPNEDSTTASTGRGRRSNALSSPGVTQITGSVRIGQSLFERTGLSLAGSYQMNLRKDSRYLGSTTGLIADDEIFDDHYGYEGPQASLMLTQILPWDIKARLSGNWQRRTYSTQPAYDDAGAQIAAQRLDTRSSFNVTLTVPLKPLHCTLGLAYDRIWNSSNDPYYAYTNNAFTIQLSFP
jgi:hypothetical protein